MVLTYFLKKGKFKPLLYTYMLSFILKNNTFVVY